MRYYAVLLLVCCVFAAAIRIESVWPVSDAEQFARRDGKLDPDKVTSIFLAYQYGRTEGHLSLSNMELYELNNTDRERFLQLLLDVHIERKVWQLHRSSVVIPGEMNHVFANLFVCFRDGSSVLLYLSDRPEDVGSTVTCFIDNSFLNLRSVPITRTLVSLYPRNGEGDAMRELERVYTAKIAAYRLTIRKENPGELREAYPNAG